MRNFYVNRMRRRKSNQQLSRVIIVERLHDCLGFVVNKSGEILQKPYDQEFTVINPSTGETKEVLLTNPEAVTRKNVISVDSDGNCFNVKFKI